MSSRVYQNRSENSIDKAKLVAEAVEKVIFAQNNTLHKVARRIGITPQGLDHYVQKKKKEGKA